MVKQSGDNQDGKPLKWEEKSFVEKLKDISTIIGATVAAIGGILVILQGVTTFTNSNKDPVITVNNHLALPIIVVINESEIYTKRIEAGASERITVLSESDFPVRVTWSVIRNKNGAGEEMGEQLSITNKNPIRVDKEGEVNITNVIGGKTYFYPKINNNLNEDCIIVINDGLVIQYTIGASRPYSRTGITGYFKYADNSNVTLYCNGQPMWHGKRNGVSSLEKLPVQSWSGIAEITFP